MDHLTEIPEARSFALSPEQLAWAAQAASPWRAHLLVIAVAASDPSARLKQAIETVMRRHGALRHTFGQVPGFRGLRQQVLQVPALAWAEHDLRGQGAQAFGDWMACAGTTPWDASHDQVIRADLVRADGANQLVLRVLGLAADTGSLSVLCEAIAQAFSGDEVAEEQEVFQYEQFASWRRELAEDVQVDEDAQAHWQAQASMASPRLSYRRTVQAGESIKGRVLANADAQRAARLAAFASQRGVSAECVLRAAWWTLLARLTGEDRFIGGWQHDCRDDYDVMQGAIGVFEKILPVGVDVAMSMSFADWLAGLAVLEEGHVQHQEQWSIESPSTTAHLEVGVFGTRSAAGPAMAGHGWRAMASPPADVPFELALGIERVASGEVSWYIHHELSRYSAKAAQCLLEQYETWLDGALAKPLLPMAKLPVIGPVEQSGHRLAYQGRYPFPESGASDVGTVASSIAHWARATPEAPALSEEGSPDLSYSELAAKAATLAAHLRQRGVQAGDVVGLNLPRSVNLIVAMLAIWEAGAAYLPIDPAWPDARRQVVLQDALPRCVLSASEIEAAWRASASASAPGRQPGKGPAPGDAAYVLYTSGSTGTPKGVVIEHAALHNYAETATKAMGLTVCRRWGLTSSVAADLGNTALFGALHNGACLVVASEQDMQDGPHFARFMARHRIDALKIVPSHLEALLDADAPSLPKTLVLGGEAAPRELVERIVRLDPACRVFNHYGPTEATIGVLVHALDTSAALPEMLPLTDVLDHNHVLLLDDALAPVPVGSLGEVYIGGRQLCHGYLKQADSPAFVAHPFAAGQRLYRTGDLAYALPEGGLRLAGRADDQVKVRGFRVEPADIEAALLTLDGVRQAVVLPLPGPLGGIELGAFIVGDAEAKGTWPVHLARLLPSHMVPVRWTCASAFPRLANGKIDRQALIALATGPAAAAPSSAAPRDEVEALLVECMAAVLGQHKVGIDEDFFELGGHSLLAIKLAARVRKRLNVEIQPGLVFDHPTAATLAAVLRREGAVVAPAS